MKNLNTLHKINGGAATHYSEIIFTKNVTPYDLGEGNIG